MCSFSVGKYVADPNRPKDCPLCFKLGKWYFIALIPILISKYELKFF